MERVRDAEHAKRLLKQLEDERRPRHEEQPDVPLPSGRGSAGIVAQPGDRIELDPAELSEALRRLDDLRDEISLRLAESAELERPFGDGRGPVAEHMRTAFGLRGSDIGGGVQFALRSYLDELRRLRDALHDVGATHRAQDESVADGMRKL